MIRSLNLFTVDANMSLLVREFERIRSEYFPGWDKKHEWKVVESHPECVGDGYCDKDSKQIVVNSDDLSLVIIHEIAHAVTYDGHGKRWRRRMEAAARRAEYLGQIDLSTQIRNEHALYLDPSSYIRPTAEFVYNGIKDAAIDGLSFEDAVAFVAKSNGMTSDKLQTRYRKLWQAYRE